MRITQQVWIGALFAALLLAPQAGFGQWLYEGLGTYFPGDATGDQSQNLDDIIYLVEYHYKSGPPPRPVLMAGDADCDGRVTVRDIIHEVNYVIHHSVWPCFYAGLYYLDTTGFRESELLAMWLSGEIRAPDTFLARVRNDLSRIRTRFGTYHTGATGVQFYFPFVLTDVVLRANSSTVDSMLAGTYTAWDSLNHVYGLESVRLVVPGQWLLLRFEFESNPGRLAQIYQTLPGVIKCTINHWLGDWPTVYPLRMGDTITYLFRAASGDCPAGCAISRYWYFAALPDSAWWIGDWDPELEPSPPGWWAEAFENIQYYPYGPYATLVSPSDSILSTLGR